MSGSTACKRRSSRSLIGAGSLMGTTRRAAIPTHVPSRCVRTDRTRERQLSAICAAPASLWSSQRTRRSKMSLTQKELDELLGSEPKPPPPRPVHWPFPSVTALTVPSQFGEDVQRKADHFETLLGVLKVLAHSAKGEPSDSPFW